MVRISLFFLAMWAVEGFSQNTLAYTGAERHYQAGMEFIEKKNFASARQEFQRYLESQRTKTITDDYSVVDAEYQLVLCALYLESPDAELLADNFAQEHSEHPRASQLFAELGKYFYNAGAYERAIPFLSKANTDEASFQLGMAYFYTEKYDQALIGFNRVALSTSEFSVPANYYSGVIFFKKNEFELATDAFRRVESSKAFGHEVPGWLAHCLYRQKKYNELLAYGKPILQAGKNSGKKLDELAMLMADVYFQQNDFARAAETYQLYANYKGGKLPPPQAYRYGYAQFRTNDFPGAIANFKQIAAGKDTLAQYAALYLGISYLNTENLQYSLAAFDQARRLNHNKSVKEEAAFSYAKVQLDLGSTDATRDLDDFIKNYPSSSYGKEARELRNEALFLSKNYRQVLDYLEGEDNLSQRQKVQYQFAAYQMGSNAFNAENFSGAAGLFDRSQKYSSDRELTLLARFWKAEALSADQKYAEAIPLYQALINSSENSNELPDWKLRSRYALGYAYFNTKDYPAASTQFRAYTDAQKNLNPRKNYEDALLRLADTYLVAKKYDEAAKIYDQVVTSGTSDKDNSLYFKGLAYLYADKNSEAKIVFTQLYSQFPNSRYADDALFQLGMAEMNAQNYPLAVKGFTRLLDDKPKSSLVPAGLLQRAVANGNLNQFDLAITDYRTILSKYSTSKSAESAILGIQEALNSAGRPEEFSSILREYEKKNPGDESLEKIKYEAAKNLYFSEKFSPAIEAFLDFIQKYPASQYVSESNFYLGESYFKTNDKPTALKFFNRVIADGKTAFTGRAANRAGEMSLQNQDFRSAVRYFQVFQSSAVSKKEIVTAQLGLMEAYFQLNKLDSASVYSREILLAGNVVIGAANRSQLMLGKIALAKGENKKAIEEFDKTARLAKDAYGAEATYLSALTLYKDKLCKESRDKIINELKEFPEQQQKWIDKGFLLLADDYICLNEIFQAKALLNTIIEQAEDKAIAAEARKKLNALETK